MLSGRIQFFNILNLMRLVDFRCSLTGSIAFCLLCLSIGRVGRHIVFPLRLSVTKSCPLDNR